MKNNKQLFFDLSISGAIFPMTEKEMECFDIIHSDYKIQNDVNLIDPLLILKMNKPLKKNNNIINLKPSAESNWVAAARGNSNVSEKTINKIKAIHKNSDEESK